MIRITSSNLLAFLHAYFASLGLEHDAAAFLTAHNFTAALVLKLPAASRRIFMYPAATATFSLIQKKSRMQPSQPQIMNSRSWFPCRIFVRCTGRRSQAMRSKSPHLLPWSKLPIEPRRNPKCKSASSGWTAAVSLNCAMPSTKMIC